MRSFEKDLAKTMNNRLGKCKSMSILVAGCLLTNLGLEFFYLRAITPSHLPESFALTFSSLKVFFISVS